METHGFTKGFGSDNHAGIHPQILKSIVELNHSHAPSYGTDAITLQLQRKLQQLFGSHAKGFFVFNGTAANTLSLKTLLPSWKSLLCADISHLNMDECGAPEAIAGLKLIPVKTNETGKLTVEALKPHITRMGDQHFSQPGGLSITQPTEIGTVYTLEELKELASFAKKNQLKLHIDGARLSNAVDFLQTDFLALLQAFPADALSFGGTKNGLLGGEMVILWDKQLKKEFPFIRKQGLQLPSKCRFIAGQFLAYFQDDLYLKIAKAAHEKALLLAKRLRQFPEIEQLYPVESNAVFVRFPKAWTSELKACKFFYIWDPEQWSARLMTSFDTTDSDIEEFCQTVEKLHLKSGKEEL